MNIVIFTHNLGNWLIWPVDWLPREWLAHLRLKLALHTSRSCGCIASPTHCCHWPSCCSRRVSGSSDWSSSHWWGRDHSTFASSSEPSCSGRRSTAMTGTHCLLECRICLEVLTTDLYIITQILYRLFESNVKMKPPFNLPPMAASSVISVKLCWWTVCGCKYIANKLYRSKNKLILIGGTFSMFNIIKTPRNYICTRELLHDSNVAFHCTKSLAAILGGKLSEEVFCRPSTAPVIPFHAFSVFPMLINHLPNLCMRLQWIIFAKFLIRYSVLYRISYSITLKNYNSR